MKGFSSIAAGLCQGQPGQVQRDAQASVGRGGCGIACIRFLLQGNAGIVQQGAGIFVARVIDHLAILGARDRAEFLRFDSALNAALEKQDAAALALLVRFPLRVNQADGSRVSLDNAAAATAGPVFSAHEPTPEEGDEAEVATQRSFLQGRTVITDGLALLDVTLEPQVIENNRWGRLFSLATSLPEQIALGLSDGAALMLNADGARVLGDGVLFVLDLRQAALDFGDNQQFVIANGLLDLFAPGDQVRATAAIRRNK